MSNQESIAKTFGVATGLCVVCAIIVSLSSVALKGIQDKNKVLDKQVNILKAAGLVAPAGKASAAEVETKFADATAVVVELATGEIVADVDPVALEKDKTNLVALDKTVDVAGIKKAPKRTVVYLVKNGETGALQTVVLPIRGTGLWSTLYGFISLNADLKTVSHIVFYEHGETPGLGGEISNPNWTAKWSGKIAFDASGAPILRVIKGTVDPNSADGASEIDGISGATLTGNGVTKTVEFWLGENGFGPFLKNGVEPLQAALNAAAEKTPVEKAGGEKTNGEKTRVETPKSENGKERAEQ